MSLIFPKKEILYAPMLGTLGGGSARGYGFSGISVLAGEVFVTDGTQANWTVPADVYSISVVAVGGGGAGGDYHDGMGGGGGALAYKNNISVSPGDTITLTAGAAGRWASLSGTRSNTAGQNGGQSYLSANGTTYALAYGGVGGNSSYTTNSYYGGASYSNADGGGEGGQILNKSGSRTGGSGAGGYSGNGGRMGAYFYDTNYGATSGTGGAGGGGEGLNGGGVGYCSGGGGVGIYGEGASGSRSDRNSASSISAAYGGSGGGNASLSGGFNSFPMPNGGLYGGGGGGAHNDDYPGNGQGGAVRVVWGEQGRAFPSTNVDLANSYGNVTEL